MIERGYMLEVENNTNKYNNNFRETDNIEDDEAERLRLLKELEFKPTEEDYRQLYAEHRAELRTKKMMTMLYDPAEKKYRSYRDCMGKYGEKLAEKMLWAKKNNNGQLQSTDYSTILKIHNNKPQIKRNITKKSSERNTNQFIGLPLSLIRNEGFRHKLKKELMLYLYIRSAIVRKKFPGDKLNLFEKFYRNGKLAASISIRKLAKDLDINPKTVQTYIKSLKGNGVIETDEIKAKDAFDNQDHCVYILGFFSDKTKEMYFLERLVNE